MGYRVINGKLIFTQDLKAVYSKKNNINNNASSGKEKVSFKDTLNSEIDKNSSFTISNHAAERLKSRNINFSESDMKNINSAINKAENKGCTESALLYNDTVLITSIKNRTVITAVDKNSSSNNVFTNIDSMVIV
ncbi:flagellar operon protein [Clostridium algifaecis]|uniref:Flagellar operon protein n=1 Tax=Clostridium algifaecis TaxID=1472040 RepID=A0ABS4KP95_9CLOT|nr:TIGR02530 family flagellar biosynthesis protein [Clostridium algifaecis]MBP2031385.1 flagellar operon protein [Clostridium algifaecis]